MKKKLVMMSLLLSLALCGCAKQDQSKPENSGNSDSSVDIIVPESSDVSMGDKLISRPESVEPSAPEGSIRLEEAEKMLDGYTMGSFYLTEPMSTYQKYYFGTVNYRGAAYYSFYPYLLIDGKRVLVGTNCLVSCNGKAVLAQNWMGGYDPAEKKTEGMDESYQKQYPDAKISPNEALAVLVKKSKVLSLEKDISDYVFELDESLKEAGSALCYCITPKLEYTDHITLVKSYFVTADGSNTVLVTEEGAPDEYRELK